MDKYEVSIPNWVNQVTEQVAHLMEQSPTMTAKQVKYRPAVVDQQLELTVVTNEEERGFFGADEFLKMFKNDAEGAWQCWIPREQEPMIAFVKQSSTTTFYLYVLTAGLV